MEKLNIFKERLVIIVSEKLLLILSSFFLLSFRNRWFFEECSGSQFFKNTSSFEFLLESLQGTVYRLVIFYVYNNHIFGRFF